MPGKHRKPRRRPEHRSAKAAIATAVGVVLGAAGLDVAMAIDAPPRTADAARVGPAHPVRDTPVGALAGRDPAAQDSSEYVRQVVGLVNAERAGHGCAPVRWNAVLQRAAQRHSDDMATRHFFDHTNPDGSDPGERITRAGYAWSAYGENISVGRATPSAVMNAWMDSPGHRRNILQCDLADIGVGIRFGTGGPWWTQDLAAPVDGHPGR
ncbi:CAP domain-containing protein [Streptomyces sp. NPDC050355]|uniref:CAP domain-containing protein n=1 Tax=Streptomyces sp. NPDC050355 TaxID=3365609 RepID=UPI0037BB188B